MATERILMAESGGLAALAKPVIAAGGGPEIVGVQDGARCVAAFTKLCQASRPPVLIILDEPLKRIGMRATALALRAIERAYEMSPTAMLFYTEAPAGEDLKSALAQIGRAVHLQRPAGQASQEQAQRLAVAVDRLLAQVRK